MSRSGVDCPDTGEISEYHLTWNNYNTSIISFLKLITPSQELENSLSDVELSCGGHKTFQAHRLVLVTCSSYFRHIFLGKGMVGDKGSCPGHPIVFIPDLSEEVLELILGFMYKGEITVPSHLILPLMEAARLLGVQGLTEPSDSSASSDSQVSPEASRSESLAVDQEQSNLVIDTTKMDSDTEDLSQADSEESDKKSVASRSEQANGTEIAFADSTKPLFSKSSFPTLTPLPNPLALSMGSSSTLSLGLNLESSLGFPTSSQRRKSSPSRCSKSPRLTSPSSTSGQLLQTHLFPGPSRPFSESQRSFPNHLDSTHHYPKTQDPTRPFACSICPKRFRMKHHLKEHNLIHSGEMPFSCHLCPKRFNRSYTLKNHMKLHSSSNQAKSQDGKLGPNLMVPLLSNPPSFP